MFLLLFSRSFFSIQFYLIKVTKFDAESVNICPTNTKIKVGGAKFHVMSF